MALIGVLWAVAIAFSLVVIWFYQVNLAMQAVPESMAKAAPHRWTKQQIRDTYERVKKKPTDFRSRLPPPLDRRYVVFGGAGKSTRCVTGQRVLIGPS